MASSSESHGTHDLNSHQEKAPEWAVAKAKTLVPDYVKRSIVENIALALSQAYERGQVDMRERAAGVSDDMREHLDAEHAANPKDGPFTVKGGSLSAKYISRAIRSLPIDGKDS